MSTIWKRNETKKHGKSKVGNQRYLLNTVTNICNNAKMEENVNSYLRLYPCIKT
jgi:hypothetical protein